MKASGQSCGDVKKLLYQERSADVVEIVEIGAIAALQNSAGTALVL